MCNQHKSFGQQKHLSTSLQLYIYTPSLYRTQCSLFCLNILSGDGKYSGIQFTQLICQRSRSRFTPTNAFLSGFFCWKFVSFGNNKPIEWRKNALSVISSHLWKVLKKTSFICHYGIIDTYIQIFQKIRTSEFGKQLFKTTLYSHISYQSWQIWITILSIQWFRSEIRLHLL